MLPELKTTYKGEIKFTWEQAQKVYTASIGLNHEEHEQKVSENTMQHSQVVVPPNSNNGSKPKEEVESNQKAEVNSSWNSKRQ